MLEIYFNIQGLNKGTCKPAAGLIQKIKKLTYLS